MSAFAIKIIICVAMFIDHIGAVFPNASPFVFRVIGRISFPVFAYFIAEGCLKTRDIYKYMLRLGIFALISEIPFDLAFKQFGHIEGAAVNFLDGTNVLYTLFLGCAAVAVIKEMPKKRMPLLMLLPVILVAPVIMYVPEFDIRRPQSFLFSGIRPGTAYWWLPMFVTKMLFLAATASSIILCKFLPNRETETASAPAGSPPPRRLQIGLTANSLLPLLPAFVICCGASVLDSDYGLAGAGLAVLYYISSPSSRLSRCLVCLAGVLYIYGTKVVETYFDTITDMMKTEINVGYLYLFLGALLAAPLLAAYNGKQGIKMKWAFYSFYPDHLAIIAIAAYTMI